MGLSKPESTLEAFYAKCRIKKCKEPYTIMQLSRTQAELSWMHHAFARHQGKISTIPPYVIRSKTFAVVKE